MAKRRAPDEPASDGSTVRMEQAFKAAWAARYPGVKHVEYQYGRDRKFLKELVATLGEDGVTQLIADYFEAFFGHDPVVSRDPYPTVTKLKWHAQYLLLRRARQAKRVHPRTAENLHEAKKAMGK